MPKRNQVRIIGGQWRRRHLQFPSAAQLRPTPDRVRETVFNWLGQTLEDRICLDLFAGSGALGFESASRAARHVVMVERDRTVYSSLMANARALGADNVELRCEDAFRFLESDERLFDVVFLDPPYRQGSLLPLLTALYKHLAGGALIYLEAEDLPVIPPGYSILHRSRAGQVNYLLLESTDDGNEI